MKVFLHQDAPKLGDVAGAEIAELLKSTISSSGSARLVLATGASQFETLKHLARRDDVDWSKVECFHLDEYVGMDENHPASFRRYLRQRFLNAVPAVAAFHGVGGDAKDIAQECSRLGGLIKRRPVDVLCLGIGENGHLAFNDPPADMDTDSPYIVVRLDDACRRQQLGEGWFATLEDVPKQAITMSMRQLLSARHIVASVPDLRKARAVHESLTKPIGPTFPGTAIREHQRCSLHLDKQSASLLSADDIRRFSE
jgi:glucosamine-6-phosphate deaminase